MVFSTFKNINVVSKIVSLLASLPVFPTHQPIVVFTDTVLENPVDYLMDFDLLHS